MKKKLSFVISFIMIFTLLAQNIEVFSEPAIFNEDITRNEELSLEEEIRIHYEGNPVDHISLAKDEKLELSVKAYNKNKPDYQWQILVEDNIWVDISGETAECIVISYPMVVNLLENDRVFIRVKVEIENEEILSQIIEVEVDYSKSTDVEEPSNTENKKVNVKEEVDSKVKEKPEENKAQEKIQAPEQEKIKSKETELEEVLKEDKIWDSDDLTEDSVNIEPNIEKETTKKVDQEVLEEDRILDTSKKAKQFDSIDETQLIKYNITINYVFENGQQAANSWAATVAAGTKFSQDIESPSIVGYTPEVETVNLNYPGITKDETVIVTYYPTQVDYKVIHYHQNITDDNYTKHEEETIKGFTESTVSADLIKNYPGFFSLLYDKTITIAADGSTIVEIYYDRYYYLMTFNLDAGYGVEPIYARYGSEISVATPLKAGYTFNDWNPKIPLTMTVGGGSYKASWTASETKFTVQYMLEDPNIDGKYNFWGSYKASSTSGAIVNGANYQKYPEEVSKVLDSDEKEYSYYGHADSDVVIKGNGTTFVNVYYKRKEYTLKFYYAMKSGNTNYVIGGSTYYFGKSAGNVNKNDEIELLDQYMRTPHFNQRGIVLSEPELNENGKKKDYIIGFDESTVNKIKYQYKYISFKAKYGSDLTDKWPIDIFSPVETDGNTAVGNNWKGTTAYASAWNGEHNVRYSQDEKNQTIKGKYGKLDKKILWDKEKFGEPSDSTISYLCFWENGADIEWSIPKLFRYNIYVPVLEGEDTIDLETRDFKGITYYERDEYNTVDDSSPKGQTQPALEGFTASERTSTVIDKFDNTKFKEAFDMYFYYTRNKYNLYYNSSGIIDKTISDVPYEKPIINYVPDYPSNLEPNAYVFDGWSEIPDFTAESPKIDFKTFKMPARNFTLYARWVPKEHKVKIYKTNSMIDQIGEEQSISHGKNATEPSIPNNGEYIFVGWFYKEDNTEKAFNFKNPVVKDLELYAKWSSNVLMDYTIRYKIEGTDIEVANPTSGSSLAGNTKTFDAKAGSELYLDYNTGYFPKTNSHSLTLDTTNIAKNEYTFEYVKKPEVDYTVRYLEQGTGNELLDDKNGTTSLAVLTENFEVIEDYLPDDYQKRLVLSSNEDQNIITFWYVKNTTNAPVLVNHYIQNKEGNEYTVYQTKTDLDGGIIGEKYSIDILSIEGFKYSKSKVDDVDSHLIENRLTGKVQRSGLKLEIYYDRIEYPYEFRYMSQGDNEVLADPFTATDRFQAQVTKDPKVIPGYTVQGGAQALTIQIETGETADNNIKTFYYTEKKVAINYQVVGPQGENTVGKLTRYNEILPVISGTTLGTRADAQPGYRFIGWYYDEALTEPVISEGWLTQNEIKPQKTKDYDITADVVMGYEAATYYAKFVKETSDLTIIKKGFEKIDENQSFIFNIKGIDENTKDISLNVTVRGEGSVIINDLPVGKYEIIEDEAWSWRYKPVGDNPKSITITSDGDNTLNFNNSRANNKWLNGFSKSVKNIFGKSK